MCEVQFAECFPPTSAVNRSLILGNGYVSIVLLPGLLIGCNLHTHVLDCWPLALVQWAQPNH